MRDFPNETELSRRERQIMDALYRLGRATAAEVREALSSPPTNTAVRTQLAILERKGLVHHQDDGTRFIYEPVVSREEMAKRVIGGVLRTFFENSVERVVATLVNRQTADLSPEELDRLAQIIEQARKSEP